MILVYDNSFEGFLTLVYETFYKKLKPNLILKNKPETLVLEELIFIKTDEKKALKVLSALKTKFPNKALNLIFNTFFCDLKNFEFELLNFIILGFKEDKELFNINNSCVFYLQNLEKELFRNLHKMYGFIRFQELEDKTLYAKIDTKFNLVYLLGKHFLKRLNTQNFIIHDIKRELAFIKNENFEGIQKVFDFEEPSLSKDEEKFKKLWNSFFNAVNIKTRENKRCQQNFVPLFYRTYMTEFL